MIWFYVQNAFCLAVNARFLNIGQMAADISVNSGAVYICEVVSGREDVLY